MSADDTLMMRLRARAESEREIQRNNEAVAEALSAQLEAFKLEDGTHNNFAVRLGLEHRNCAKRDAELAADWDEAASALEAAEAKIAALTAELDSARADFAWMVKDRNAWMAAKIAEHDRVTALTAENATLREDSARLDWLESNRNAELAHEGWEEDVWQVHTVNGGRNDREWTLLAEGDTVREAIDAARAALRQEGRA